MSKLNRREFLKRVAAATAASIWMVRPGGEAFVEAEREDKGNGYAEVSVEEDLGDMYFVRGCSPYFCNGKCEHCPTPERRDRMKRRISDR